MSVESFAGFVAKLNTKTGTGRRGAWTLTSAKIEKADGSEYPDWVSFGFDGVKFKEGDFIKFDAQKGDDGRYKVVDGTIKGSKNPPARSAKKSGGGGGSGGGSRGGGRSFVSSAQKFDGSGISNTMNPVDAKRVGLSAARTAALEAITLLLAANALPLTKAATKAGEAARYEEVTAAVDKLTVRFYNDTVTGRLLETVADEGNTGELAKQAQDPLPDADEEAADSDDTELGGSDDGDGDDIPL